MCNLHTSYSQTMEHLFSLVQPFLEFQLPFLAVILVTLGALVGGYFKLKISPYLGKKLPPGSLGFAVFGESISFIRAQKQDKTREWLESRMAKYGPVFKTSLFGSSVVVVTGQAGNRLAFSANNDAIATNQPITIASILGKYSIFELEGRQHKLVRGAIMSFLRPESIQRYVGEMDSVVKQQLLQEFDCKDSIQFVTLMKKITFKVTCSLLFGLPEGKEKDALLENFSVALKGAWALPLNFPGTTFRLAIQARGRICKILSHLIKRRKIEMEEGKVGSHEDVISSFLNLRDESGKPLLEEEIIDNLVSLIIASHDTITILLSLFVRHLAKDADVYEKVLEEQKRVVKAREENNGEIRWSEMQMMKYTWRVAQELLRVTPPAFGGFRSAIKDTTFGGFDIPKGWKVFWVSITHMDKNIFEEPDKFDPSRFENPSESLPPYTYIPFGAGPRICPGVEFARIEVLLIIHHLITNYQWTEMIPNEPITRDPMPYPAMGLPVKLHPRKDL